MDTLLDEVVVVDDDDVDDVDDGGGGDCWDNFLRSSMTLLLILDLRTEGDNGDEVVDEVVDDN